MAAKETEETKIRIHIIVISMHGIYPKPCLYQEGGEKREYLAKILIIVPKSVIGIINCVNFIARTFLH